PQARDRGELTYEYGLSVVVTDEGGETRDTNGSFRIGHASVEGSIANDRGFLLAGRPVFLTVIRRDLNGVPRREPAPGRSTSCASPRRPSSPATSRRPRPGRPGFTRRAMASARVGMNFLHRSIPCTPGPRGAGWRAEPCITARPARLR